ncbi:MAG: pantetheine-phosphate adenylyltransferase [Chloroflexi bacterium]|jgi:pantetheine-phosphate adenylyltransferase|nr:MAG: phosphopantetheine adenylyltransferase [Chloroflexi bacterium OLB13]MBC6954996.1 pantetheine-phosphate adenylyltransferase [Chloroflexota bacterium]MBV6435448.1 Phosphopantetheine adenylyltransferase [Anaerolineae bacterium]MDL1914453.1 pantetheine-phosphate adenylyltransferase [Anaerolineae bacterium CFX4]OQY85589.1 MAG: pantetheine-phosphate adenylyltransferase [Anaerolineae bacterium UTCFX5]
MADTGHIAVYPGSFDPIHNGHIDVAERAAKFFDKVIVAAYDLPKKRLLFDADRRMEMMAEALRHIPNVEVAKFSGLLVNYVASVGAMAIIRGLRVFSDFEFEFRMGLANKKLAPDIETISIMADERHIHISSSTIREIAELGGDVSTMVPGFVDRALVARFEELRALQPEPGYTISIRD